MQVQLPHGPDWFRWSVDGPLVMPGGINLLRSVIQPTHQPAGYSFDLSVARPAPDQEGADHYLGILADIAVGSDEWHCAASVLMNLQFRDSKDLDASDHELISTYGPWCSHVIWDVFAIHGRALSAAHGAEISFPLITPEPTSLLPVKSS